MTSDICKSGVSVDLGRDKLSPHDQRCFQWSKLLCRVVTLTPTPEPPHQPVQSRYHLTDNQGLLQCRYDHSSAILQYQVVLPTRSMPTIIDIRQLLAPYLGEQFGNIVSYYRYYYYVLDGPFLLLHFRAPQVTLLAVWHREEKRLVHVRFMTAPIRSIFHHQESSPNCFIVTADEDSPTWTPDDLLPKQDFWPVVGRVLLFQVDPTTGQLQILYTSGHVPLPWAIRYAYYCRQSQELWIGASEERWGAYDFHCLSVTTEPSHRHPVLSTPAPEDDGDHVNPFLRTPQGMVFWQHAWAEQTGSENGFQELTYLLPQQGSAGGSLRCPWSSHLLTIPGSHQVALPLTKSGDIVLLLHYKYNTYSYKYKTYSPSTTMTISGECFVWFEEQNMYQHLWIKSLCVVPACQRLHFTYRDDHLLVSADDKHWSLIHFVRLDETTTQSREQKIVLDD